MRDLEVDCVNNNYTSLNGAKYYKLIAEKMKVIHSKIPEQSFDICKIASTDVREEFFEGKNQKRFVMYLM